MLAYTPVRNEYGQVIGYKWRNKFGKEETTPVAASPWQASPVPPAPPRADLSRFQRLSMYNRSRFGASTPTLPDGTPSPWNTNYQMTGNPAAGAGVPQQQGAGNTSSSSGPLAKQLYAKFAGNVQSAAGGSPTDQDYTQSDRAYNAAQRAYDRNMQQRAASSTLQANPIWALPPSSVSEADYGYWSNLPLGQLTYLQRGTSGPDRFGDSPNRLENAMQRTANSMQNMDATTLLSNLFGANRNSAVGRSFQAQQMPDYRFDDQGLFQGVKDGKWKWAPASQQAGVMQSYLNAIYGTQYPEAQQQPAMNYVNRLIDQWAARAYGKNNPGSLINWLGTRMGY